MSLVTKYAKDLQPGDKINGHERGWLIVSKVERLHLSHYTVVIFAGGEQEKIDSHAIFDAIVP